MIKQCMLNRLSYWRINDTFVALDENLRFSFKPRDFPSILKPLFDKAFEGPDAIDSDEDIIINVPKGFVTDLASIPKWLQWLFKPDGKWAKAAAIHDFLYNTFPVFDKHEEYYLQRDSRFVRLEQDLKTRSLSDGIFYIAMRQTGVNPIISFLFYLAVRFGGGKHYHARRSINVVDMLMDNSNTFHYSKLENPTEVFTGHCKTRLGLVNGRETDFAVIDVPNLPTPLVIANQSSI